MPAHWREFKIHYRYRETVYHITVSQTQAGEAGSLSVDGIEQPGNAIALIDDHREHRVEAGHGGGMMKVGAGGTAAVGHLPSLDDSGKQPSRPLLYLGTCRNANSHNPA